MKSHQQIQYPRTGFSVKWNQFFHGWKKFQVVKRKAKPQLVLLTQNKIWSAHLASGTILHCSCGMCWVTQKGEFNDEILRSGGQLILRKSTFVVISALGTDAEILVK